MWPIHSVAQAALEQDLIPIIVKAFLLTTFTSICLESIPNPEDHYMQNYWKGSSDKKTALVA